VRIRFLLGPAGSGKTFRCLAELRQALADSPGGPPLLLVAPKQTTYQLERQLLAHAAIAGYARLHILSFERLGHYVFSRLRKPAPEMLDEEGRVMVLRGLLAGRRDELKLFRASARLTGFAQQLSGVLGDLQRHLQTPETLRQLAERVRGVEGLAYKLQDLSTLLRDYLDWLQKHQLQDAERLLNAAARALQPESEDGPQTPLIAEHLWVDGFAELSPREMDLLAALIPHCGGATLTFCLERVPSGQGSWLSSWSVSRLFFEECKKRLGSLAGAAVSLELIERQPGRTRFLASPPLGHLEQFWSSPQPYSGGAPAGGSGAAAELPPVGASVRLALCASPEEEAVLAAREILRLARAGGRYRDVTVLVRKLEGYHEPIQRVFSRYEIPYFLDRRESVSHHPLAELTRGALRTVAFQWQREDWFAALKTGLVPAAEIEIDRLENEALARGWQGAVWQKPIVIREDDELTEWLADLHTRLLPPFQRLALAIAARKNKPDGPELAAALRGLWNELQVRDTLTEWARADAAATGPAGMPNSVHTTVWEQMNAWLDNVVLAFRNEPLPVREWLPILEAGLANLTVGVIPPALDQVLVGTVDRSRSANLKLALVLGLNESVFPAPPETDVVLNELDRVELEKLGVDLGGTTRRQLSRERHHAYMAFTRARERLVLTCSQMDAGGSPLNPSPFLAQVRRLFPGLELERPARTPEWSESEHFTELVGPALKMLAAAGGAPAAGGAFDPGSAPGSELPPALAVILERVRHFQNPEAGESLAPELAARLYGGALRTSVSRLEQYAACPFRFFVHSGLRAEERRRFELDVKEQGSFQHDVLALFHEQLARENKRWRDITGEEARERTAAIAHALIATYRDGLLQASEESRFMARVLIESLQDFVETLVTWMRRQYRFDPVKVELPFGEDAASPAWKVDLGEGRRLELYGRIDRVDLCLTPEGEALCVVVDYKSSQKQLDPVLLEHGLQLQLLAYLNVLRRWALPVETFGASRLIPAGVFYVNLRGKYDSEANRADALLDPGRARRLAYRHTGRFDLRALRHLDSRPDAIEGDQFKYRLTKTGQVYKSSHEALNTAEFEALLDAVETNLVRMGRDIFAGRAQVSPYRKGGLTACDQCGYQSICRIDPWTHNFRVLKKAAPAGEEGN
jgi:ATP-dependent helicase/nuclease subunit B